ncbi:MAG: MerR family DNA-binding transcriptional regulator [Acidibrevibacterium sp.]|jgi:DNA-binding transcriptional MerR regulator|uniref:MerR family transcriptional regulator n=1 Tax=Acidibrevibacterium TaxID=2603324 RepID=UPI000E0CD800|nr:MerR family DNA-binding transcriptional regulator [Acidibrevibacterium fodinaquatile]MCA7118113.1 MerR family DNA-binding transcriptional regulator [Acidibrevibacterium fodinaquatile]
MASVPAAPSHPERLYTVTQLSKEIGVTPRAIRFYEDKGLILPRRAGTTRVYTNRDRARMILILRGKRLGFSLREIREYLELYDIDTSQGSQLRLLLKLVRARLATLVEQERALTEILAELREVERQAVAALEAKPPSRKRLAG